MDTIPPTLTLCTDDVFVDDLLEKGGLDDVVRRLIGYGLDPVAALRAASFNAANRLGRPDLGLIAPGKRADIVLFDSLESLEAELTIANGEVVARNGDLAISNKAHPIPATLKQTMQPAVWTSTHFRVEADGENATVAVIEKPRFTEWGKRELSVSHGYVTVADDLTIMAIINRFNPDSTPKVAYLGPVSYTHLTLPTICSV